MLRSSSKRRRWDTVIDRIPRDTVFVGAEIGVWMGRTAAAVLAARPRLVWHMVDAWTKPEPDSAYAKSPDQIAKNDQRYFDDCYVKAVRATKRWRARAPIWRDWSCEVAMRFEDRSLDGVFIDAEHTYEGVLRDIRFWLPTVKPGGWIGGHDYGASRYPGVERAVREHFGDAIELDADHTWFHYVTEDEC